MLAFFPVFLPLALRTGPTPLKGAKFDWVLEALPIGAKGG
jgi:hypothetical protein